MAWDELVHDAAIDRKRGALLAGGLDRWLRFAPFNEDRYNQEWGTQRKADLCSAIYSGLAVYNIYNITSIVLLADVLWLSVVLRIGVVTPVSLALIWLIKRSTVRQADRTVLAGAFNAYLVPIFLFWISQDPLSLFTFGELPLTIVFANMLLALRFRHAAVFTAGVLGVTLLALAAKMGVDPLLRVTLGVQITTACIFSLHANYRAEYRRCREYLATLDARLCAEAAEEAQRRLHDLAQIDALTGLPNRRFLTERLDEWAAVSDSVALLMVDVDYFKFYNDSLGHPAGDDCLRIIARTLAAACQTPNSFAARFGGEEFTIVMRGATERDVVQLSAMLLSEIRARALPHPSRPDNMAIVTVSLGATFRPAGTVLVQDIMFVAADRALYRAKQNGRNRVVLNDRLPEPIARCA